MKTKQRVLTGIAIAVVAGLAIGAGTANAELIYVDFGHGTTAAYQTGANWANVRNGSGTTSDLVDTANNATDVSVALDVASSISSTLGFMPAEGTDAYNLFQGYVNAVGFSARGDTITLTFSGLDSSTLYDFAIFGNRINDTTVTGDEDFVLSGATGFSNISSSGTTISTTTMTDDTTAFETRDNTTTGYIARWTDINPGGDGIFTIDAKTSSGDTVYLNAARLAVIPEPASGALFVLVGGMVWFVRRKLRA